MFGTLIAGHTVLDQIERQGSRNGTPKEKVEITKCSEIQSDDVAKFKLMIADEQYKISTKNKEMGVTEIVQEHERFKQEKEISKEKNK